MTTPADRSLAAYLKALQQELAGILPFNRIILAPEIPTELQKPVLLLRMSTAEPSHQDSAQVNFQALLYWEQFSTTQLRDEGNQDLDEDIGGMDVAFQIYSQITRYELASGVFLQSGVVSEADGYVDYVISWNDKIENDYRLRDPNPPWTGGPVGRIVVNSPSDSFHFDSPDPNPPSEA